MASVAQQGVECLASIFRLSITERDGSWALEDSRRFDVNGRLYLTTKNRKLTAEKAPALLVSCA